MVLAIRLLECEKTSEEGWIMVFSGSETKYDTPLLAFVHGIWLNLDMHECPGRQYLQIPQELHLPFLR